MNLKRRDREQKIAVSCLLKRGNEVLLLRSSQALNEANYTHPGYFNLPRFYLNFGEDPEELLRREFLDLFNQQIDELELLDVTQSRPDEYTHLVNIIYGGQTDTDTAAVGKYMFTKIDELENYAFPGELERIKRFLGF